VNAYGEFTNQTCLTICLDWQVDNASFVTNWWVGDYSPSFPELNPPPYGHLLFYGNGDFISDNFIYIHGTDNGTKSSKSEFSFIWTCANGGRYWNDTDGHFDAITGIVYNATSPFYPPPDNTNDEYGYKNNTSGEVYGMPLAWTGYSDMTLDGYNNPSGNYCYIGWEGPSVMMIDCFNGTDCLASTFVYAFYYKALGFDDPNPYYLHQCPAESLDFASQIAYDLDFDGTELYTGYWQHADYGWFYVHMRVMGNSYMLIPMSW
jgi:hypothetical protein